MILGAHNSTNRVSEWRYTQRNINERAVFALPHRFVMFNALPFFIVPRWSVPRSVGLVVSKHFTDLPMTSSAE